MKIVVCLKQVPEMESKFRIIDENHIDESQVVFKINDFDNYAVEEALQLRDRSGGGEVVIVTAGPERATKDIKQAFSMGVDWGIHITDPAVYEADNYVISSALAKAIESIGDVDLVLTGVQAEDDQAAVTGIMLADILGYPSVTNVVKTGMEGAGMTVNRELEGGLNEIVSVQLPAVLSIQSGINEPRYPTLQGIMKAKKKRLDTVSGSDLGVTASARTGFIRMYFPVSEHRAEIISGEAAEAASILVDKLKNEAKVL